MRLSSAAARNARVTARNCNTGVSPPKIAPAPDPSNSGGASVMFAARSNTRYEPVSTGATGGSKLAAATISPNPTTTSPVTTNTSPATVPRNDAKKFFILSRTLPALRSTARAFR